MERGWTIDEKQHAGSEHLDSGEVSRVDEKMPFDPSGEIDVLREFGLSHEDTVVDFGTGTGVSPLAVARHCDRVVAVDVSEPMLELVDERIDAKDVENVETVHDGFLSYDHRGDPASFAVSKDALHHLPDFWKVEALKNVGNTLEAGGIFRLRDFVFSFDPDDSVHDIEAWLEEKKRTTEFTDEALYVHFREEYSTYGFVLEAMLERVGFDILESTYDGEFYAEYVCEWPGHS
ncbi:Methyltransferase domain-containing protein [Halomicrobium zhouii]|uniref:Methyltransferase domain-containing protein n=1 Tax=Halomicrobium zhouii TaxID=767519 RepID=A0A1I6L464_9EURY|nr:class I SAM-dependent methyltransferase [Halomicrobium zhouii]SFR98239.1 Methyltransferase domain-containing protein [Halomicrobium zhouii]